MSGSAAKLHLRLRRDDACKRLAHAVPQLSRPLRGGGGHRRNRREDALGIGQVDLEVDVERPGPRQHERTLQQRGRCRPVPSQQRAPTRGSQAFACALGKRPIRLTQLCAIASGLLEVEAEDLVHLDQIGPALLQPVREALVQLCANRFRQAVVRGIANEEVAEAKGVVAGQLRAIGPDQLLADEPGQSRDDRPVLRQRLHRPAVEDLALDGASLEHRALRLLELVEARGQQRLQVRRDENVRTRALGHRRHLRQEERVAAGRMRDPRAQIGR